MSSKLLAAMTVLLAVALPAVAQRTTFNPSVTIGWSYSDNVVYLGDPDSSTDDTAATASLVLPLVRRQDRGATRLTYRTGWYLYGDETQNDSNEHSLNFGLSRKTRRRATWTVASRFIITEEQQASPLLPGEIIPDEVEEPDDSTLALTSRTERQTIDATVGYGWSIGPKWSFDTSVKAGHTQFDGGTDVEDRDWYRPSFKMRNTISRKTSWAATYAYQRVELERSGDEDFHTADLSLNHDLNRKVNLGIRAGGFKRDPENSESETGAYGGVDLRLNDSLTFGPVRLGFTARTNPTGGGSQTGTSLDSTAGVVLSGVRTYPVNWRVGTYYNVSRPFDSANPQTETFSLRAAVEPAISKLLALRVGAGYSKQTSEDPTREGSFTRAAVSLVIYPLGKMRIAGRNR